MGGCILLFVLLWGGASFVGNESLWFCLLYGHSYADLFMC